MSSAECRHANAQSAEFVTSGIFKIASLEILAPSTGHDNCLISNLDQLSSRCENKRDIHFLHSESSVLRLYICVNPSKTG